MSESTIHDLRLMLAGASGLRWAQEQVRAHHYLHAQVDPRCSPLAYVVTLAQTGDRVGTLIFGRPESTRCGGWYGSVADVAAGRCPLTRWQILNLARVWLDPRIQVGGAEHIRQAATWAIAQALSRVAIDYLLVHPPCFLEEPYELREVLSYCEPAVHRGTLYRAANFALRRTNERGLQTWARPLRRLSGREHASIRHVSEQALRPRRYRAARAALANTRAQSLFATMEG